MITSGKESLLSSTPLFEYEQWQSDERLMSKTGVWLCVQNQCGNHTGYSTNLSGMSLAEQKLSQRLMLLPLGSSSSIFAHAPQGRHIKKCTLTFLSFVRLSCICKSAWQVWLLMWGKALRHCKHFHLCTFGQPHKIAILSKGIGTQLTLYGFSQLCLFMADQIGILSRGLGTQLPLGWLFTCVVDYVQADHYSQKRLGGTACT